MSIVAEELRSAPHCSLSSAFSYRLQLTLFNDNRYRTKDTLHYFDCPFQLGEDSPDRPKDGSKLSSISLATGDVIVMASDGVFDNINEGEIVGVVEAGVGGGGGGGGGFSLGGISSPARQIAKNICEMSRKVSLMEDIVTPYSVVAKKNKIEGYQDGLGGKVDDISCVCVVVS